jgi:hypothetical protein
MISRAALALLLAASSAGAQDRPTEEDLFGKPEEAPSPAAPAAPPAAAAAPAPPAPTPRESDDPLDLGGLLYLRLDVFGRDETPPEDWRLASPNLLDVYLDVRPNDRVRGFTLVRTLYDPTGTSGTLIDTGLAGDASPATTQGTATPEVFLDQLWVNFDVARTVFVTAGKQHVKWGVGKFWNPTDYLHRAPRNPLAVFDARTGVTMVRAHLPWEARSWNLYAIALLENTSAVEEPVGRLGAMGGGARAEIVLGSAEIGLDAVFQRDVVPRYGVDLSAGVWDLDLYAEAALRPGSDLPRWREIPGADPALPEPLRWEPFEDGDTVAQVTAGGSWTWKYSDEDTLTAGAEYFYNQAGYADAHAYPALLAAQLSPEYRSFQASAGGVAVPQGAYFTPYYLGRQYAGVFLTLPAPGSWNDTTFTVSVLGNLTDGTAVARLDHSVVVNTYLRIESYVAGHFGTEGGEFRLAFPETVVTIPGEETPFVVPAILAPTVDVGVALRLTL